MTGRLEGRIALVTGGTRGIGEAIAARFAREGATTVVCSRKQANVDEAVARLRESTGGEVHGYPLHIGDEQAVEAVMTEITTEHGVVDVLVNNAATNPYFGPILQTPGPAWDKTLQVNVSGTFAVTRAVVTRLLDQEQTGSVIMVSSILGIDASPLQGVYGITKAAMLSMTKTLAVELGLSGIRVNAIAPGLVDTRFAAALTSSPELREMFVGRTPLGRIAQPDDIAGTAVWLASDDSAYVTGQTIPVDGGYTVR